MPEQDYLPFLITGGDHPEGRRAAHLRERGLVPRQRVYIHEHGSGGVGDVGDVDGAAGEAAEPRVHGAAPNVAVRGGDAARGRYRGAILGKLAKYA